MNIPNATEHDVNVPQPGSIHEVISDERWAGRKRVDLPATIYLDGPNDVVRCVVRNISSTGALIEFPKDWAGAKVRVGDLPDRFTLVMVCCRDRTEVACAVARRRDQQVGVRFTGQFRTTTHVARSMTRHRAGFGA